MKPTLTLGFVIGIAIGWWLAGSLGGRSEAPADSIRRKSSARQEGGESADATKSRSQAVKVELPQDRLKQLLQAGVATGLSSDSFSSHEGIRTLASFEKLCEWAGLDAAGKTTFTEILRQSAEARRDWEARNSKVAALSPGKWKLEIPDDGGMARNGLKRRIEAAFDPDTALSLQVGGDLENFFGMENIPWLTSGPLEVTLKRVNDWKESDPEGSNYSLDVSHENSSLMMIVSASSLMQEPEVKRIVTLLGSPEEIAAKAAEASRLEVTK